MENAGLMSWHVRRNEEEIAEMEELAKQGGATAQTEYGKRLLLEKSMEVDGDATYALFEKTAEQESRIAKMYTGRCLLYGIGMTKSEGKGYTMSDDALNYSCPNSGSSQPQAGYSNFQGEDLCQLFWDLGNALENSLGVVRNCRVAYYYYDMLNSWGHLEGAERRANFRKFLFFCRKIN